MAAEKETLFQRLISQNTSGKDISDELKGWRYSNNLKIAIIVFTILSSSIFFMLPFLKGESGQNNIALEPEKIWQRETLEADFSFPILKSQEQIESETRLSRRSVLPAFTLQENIKENVIENIDKLIENIENIALIDIDRDVSISSRIVEEFLEQEENDIKVNKRKIKKELTKIFEDIYDKGLINIELEEIEKTEIAVFINPTEKIILQKTFLLDLEKFDNHIELELNKELSGINLSLAVELAKLLKTPNLVYSTEITNQLIENAINSVPKTLGIVKSGEVIIKKGEKLNEENINILRSYYKTKNLISDKEISSIFFLGSIGHAGLLVAIFMVYLAIIRKKIFKDNVKVLIICSTIISNAILSWSTLALDINLPLEYLVVIPAFSILIAILFDSRTAFYSTVTMALMLAGIRGNDYTIAATMIFSGMLAAYTVRDIQRRSQMFQSMFFILIGLVLPIFIFGAERSTDWLLISKKVSLGFLNSIISPLLAFGLLIVVERLTNFTTDLKIREYDNLNHPLLIKMSEIAPGTYQHSMGVAMLSEKCAHQIEANTLLVRVGSLFHDIGKMSKPEYFTENQIDMENKHELIPPKKSAAIIKDHVTIGVELAKQYKLPERLIDFIKTHHGTTLIKHFYAKALEDKTNGEIEENDYRYPGPKPKSKEEAIVMVCDTAEAITRISSITEDEILEIINETIQDKILDGQFNDSSITMQELEIVKDTIMRNIKGISHQRTVYKQVPKERK